MACLELHGSEKSASRESGLTLMLTSDILEDFASGSFPPTSELESHAEAKRRPGPLGDTSSFL